MVKLTTKYLYRKISKKNQLQPRRKNEADWDYLNRITHLHLQSQFIDGIAPMLQCQSVSVIYLQNNLLQSIQCMDNFPKLTHLYLQHNYISKIENLSCLPALKKLYLGHNEISVVEGFEGLKNLTELHLESQRLPPGETLYFDPRSISHLSKPLKVLNVADNNLTSVSPLEGLMNLTKLVIDRNQVGDLDDVADTLSGMPFLEELSSEGNPVTSHRKYLDVLVLAAKSLRRLNGRDIDPQTRDFITNLAASREYKRQVSECSAKALDSQESLICSRGDANISAQLPGHPLRLGSKLFPVLKRLEMDNRSVIRLPSKLSANSVSPVFQSTLKVKTLENPRSFYF